MPILLILLGIVFMDVSVRGTSTAFFQQVKQDTFPQAGGGFFTWAAVIIIIGMFGFVPSLKSASTWFLALVIVAMVVSKKSDATQAIQSLTNFIKAPGAAVSAQ